MVSKGRKWVKLSFGEKLKPLLCARRDSSVVKANMQPWCACGGEGKGGGGYLLCACTVLSQKSAHPLLLVQFPV